MNNKLKIENPIPNIRKNNDTYTQTHEESLQYALDCLFPDDNHCNDKLIHKIIRKYSEKDPNSDNDYNFTLQEVNDVIANIKPNKSCGWDQINETIIRIIHSIEPNFFNNLFNICLIFGHFPKLWKVSVVKILLKSRQTKNRN